MSVIQHFDDSPPDRYIATLARRRWWGYTFEPVVLVRINRASDGAIALVASRLNLFAILFLGIFALFACAWVAIGVIGLIDIAISGKLTVWWFLAVVLFVVLGLAFFTGGLYTQFQMARRDTVYVVEAIEASLRRAPGT